MFLPGRAKTGGRAKGVRNKETMLIDELKAHGFDLVGELLRALPFAKPEAQIAVMAKMLDFVYPKKTITEISLADAKAVIERELIERGVITDPLGLPSPHMERVEGSDGDGED